jgi:hypothetical protein
MDDVNDLLRALGTLLWPLLAGAGGRPSVPAISRRIDRGGFTVKWGDKENTASEATQQLRKAVGDLTDNLRAAT